MQELDELSFWKRAALILALVALVALLGCDDGEAAAVTAQIEAETHARLTSPSPCDFTIKQSTLAGVFVSAGCYVRPQ